MAEIMKRTGIVEGLRSSGENHVLVTIHDRELDATGRPIRNDNLGSYLVESKDSPKINDKVEITIKTVK